MFLVTNFNFTFCCFFPMCVMLSCSNSLPRTQHLLFKFDSLYSYSCYAINVFNAFEQYFRHFLLFFSKDYSNMNIKKMFTRLQSTGHNIDKENKIIIFNLLIKVTEFVWMHNLCKKWKTKHTGMLLKVQSITSHKNRLAHRFTYRYELLQWFFSCLKNAVY